MPKIIQYRCGSCGWKFRMEWQEDIVADCDLSTCPCKKCGAQAVTEESYLIFRGEIADRYIIGRLPLETARAIHKDNIILIDHINHEIIVKKPEEWTVRNIIQASRCRK